MRLLLEHGADIAALNGDGKTASQVVGKYVITLRFKTLLVKAYV